MVLLKSTHALITSLQNLLLTLFCFMQLVTTLSGQFAYWRQAFFYSVGPCYVRFCPIQPFNPAFFRLLIFDWRSTIFSSSLSQLWSICFLLILSGLSLHWYLNINLLICLMVSISGFGRGVNVCATFEITDDLIAVILSISVKCLRFHCAFSLSIFGNIFSDISLHNARIEAVV